MEAPSLEDLHWNLVQACTSGDLSHISKLLYFYKCSVERLIKGDISFTHKTKFGVNKPGQYIYIASENNFPDIVEHLIKLGGNPIQVHHSAMTPLLVACLKGNIEIVKVLHVHGVMLHPDGVSFKDSAIYCCCKYGFVNIIAFIVEKTPDLLVKPVENIGTCPGLQYADIWACLSKVSAVNGGLLLGNLLMYVACIFKQKTVVEYLVSQGVGVNSILTEDTFYSASQSPLSAACRNSHEEIAMYLLEQKAEITSSIADQFPEFTASLLSKDVKKYKRSYSMSGLNLYNSLPDDSAAVYWDNMGLHKIHRYWLETYSRNLYLLDINNNKIKNLPLDFFELLPLLEELDLSCNQLTFLPSKELRNCRLRRISISRNKLPTIPLELFLNKYISLIDASNNEIGNLPPDKEKEYFKSIWECPALLVFKCSGNILQNIPDSISGASSLEKLILNNNMLLNFSTIWKCPLNELDLSNNQLSDLGVNVQMVWSNTLLKLNLSHNSIQFISSSICELSCLQNLDMSYNLLQTLPPPRSWKCRHLSKLNLSHNGLTAKCGPDGFFGVDKYNIHEAIGIGTCILRSDCELPVEVFGDSLHSLDLSCNKLEMLPDSICGLSNLSELDLSCNDQLKWLPAELGNLKNMWNLRLNSLNIPELPFKLDGSNQAKTVLPYLREKLRQCVPFNRIKLMVIGLQGRGKTSLIASIQGKKLPPNISSVGISVQDWSLSPPTKSYVGSLFKDSNELKVIRFSSWDLAGQQVYYATHQCFLTGNTLYLAVYNVTHGNEGVDSLAPWLQNVQARAPNSRIIVVGTHIDCLPYSNHKVFLERMKKDIMLKFNKKGYPIISGCIFVSNTCNENINLLRDKIYNVADQMNGNDNNSGKTAPLSYIELYDSIVRENQVRKSMDHHPVLTIKEMQSLACSNPNNDIYDVGELITAAKFLHEHGILLHFNDHLRELDSLFFIDPSWLCEMLALVVTVRERNPFIKSGFIKMEDLMVVLRNPRLPEKFIPQFLRLLERFEIALCLDQATFLIPSMLPKERPCAALQSAMAKYVQESMQCISRNYHMNYIPAGFWSRLIARIIISVQKWGVLVTTNDCQEPPEVTTSDNSYYSMILWREGILVLHSNGYFLMESFHDDVLYEGYSNKGVTISVSSTEQDFSYMGFIIDQLDTLITEWYPGLEDVDEFGSSLVEKCIPCVTCCLKLHKELIISGFMGNTSCHFRDPQHVKQFSLSTCAIAALTSHSIYCCRHPADVVPLKLLVPDILLTDIPSWLVIDKQKLNFQPCNATLLGEGGAGGVYRARYKEMDVAIKQFHSTTKIRHFGHLSMSNDVNCNSIFNPTEDLMQDQFEDGKVVKAFWDLRQEVNVLYRLQHQNIIRFIGVSMSPLCFVLELAPLGSLQSVLEKLQVQRDIESNLSTTTVWLTSVLETSITYRIAYQVAQAIAYLHQSDIIYRDLKSDNVLVWSLNQKDAINVKISDYGISTFSTPQGVLGEGGTPGFQAPEVRFGNPYDEKVDVFSYGIWLYELISGFRPYREYRTAVEIKKAVCRGIRPSLRKDCLIPGLPILEQLMEECWKHKPVLRPSFVDIISQLKLPDVLMMQSVYPKFDSNGLERVTCICHWNEDYEKDCDDTMLLICCDEHSDRRFKIIDPRRELVIHDVICPGPRVLCAVKVNNFIWLGTEGKQIEILNSTSTSTPSVVWKISVKDPVMHMITSNEQDEHNQKIFASLANGTLLIFSKKSKNTGFSPEQESVCNTLTEKKQWSEPNVINLATQGLPAKCMVITRDGKELWVASGNFIVIVSLDRFEILDRLKALTPARSLISCMASDGVFVWLSDRKSSVISQWNVVTRKAVLKFQCNSENPEIITLNTRMKETCIPEFEEISKENFDIEKQIPVFSNKDSLEGVTIQEYDSKHGSTKSIKNLGRAVAGGTRAKILSHVVDKVKTITRRNSRSKQEMNSSKEDIKFISTNALSIDRPMKLLSVNRQPSLMLNKRTQNLCKNNNLGDRSSTQQTDNSARPRAFAYSGFSDTVVTLFYSKSCLWVGRSSGNINVLNVSDPPAQLVNVSDEHDPLFVLDGCRRGGVESGAYGKSIGTLGNPMKNHLNSMRTVAALTPVSKDKVVALIRIEPKSKFSTLNESVTRNNQARFDKFQIMLFKKWAIQSFLNFATGINQMMHYDECAFQKE